MLPGSLCGSVLVEVTVAVLFQTAHTVPLVGAVTTAVNAAPWANVPTAQFKTCAPTAPVTVQPAPDDRTHVTPPFPGSVSLITTPVAVPGPLFVTTIVNVAVWPEVIGAAPASGVFAIERPGV